MEKLDFGSNCRWVISGLVETLVRPEPYHFSRVQAVGWLLLSEQLACANAQSFEENVSVWSSMRQLIAVGGL
jgi:hypothetical protein